MKNNNNLFAKYDIAAPRYTSYPTVPYWDNAPTTDEWINSLNRTFDKEHSPWSLYIHIPFCESLCCYCACNTTISRNHDRYEDPYVNCLLKEWDSYQKLVPALNKQALKNIHLGGGTPTFLSPNNLRRLLLGILSNVQIDKDNFEGSIEVHPNYTTDEHLEMLREIGFNRISIGVQDFNLNVQKMVNRIQLPQATAKTVSSARRLGFASVNFDLIYGLPGQGQKEMINTIDKTLEFKPDRIALYSLAIVPWIKPAQRLFKDEDLPSPKDKRALYDYAKGRLLDAGYIEIGMDHFSLPNDDLAIAMNEGRLHRNFMGYTDQQTDVLLGLGVSSISASPDCFHQNQKILSLYEAQANKGIIPTMRGHKLNEEDQFVQAQILELMTKFKIYFSDDAQAQSVKSRLEPMIADKLVSFDGNTMSITEEGKGFLRVICTSLDKRLLRAKPQTITFSKAI
ncbi:MAG: oxygen-independent coproporphyrinogen III oxidase [Devosiaceae bacterium]|nr:oxygen-independent coproporphyrinogen III oxidase [Devosiaceae bacterium]